MPDLFEPFAINKMHLRNRFVRSATMDSLADQGVVTDSLLAFYRELATDEIGLIVTGGLYPRKDGQINRGQLSADRDEIILGLARLVQMVHQNGGKIAAQLIHSGWNCRPSVTGFQPVGPSAMTNPRGDLQVRELPTDEVYELAELFIQAGRRAIEAGFDAVQIHAAHSHLISAFLSPATNRRSDEWGGSPEKRFKFLRHMYEGIRKIAEPDYPVFVKFGLIDYHPQGKLLSEGIETAKWLEAGGIDAVEVSEGLEQQPGHHIRPDATAPYYLAECRQARQALRLPLILVGGMRKFTDMQSVLGEGVADAVSMCRPFISDPHIVRKFHEGLFSTSECTSCNGCLGQRNPEGLRCILA